MKIGTRSVIYGVHCFLVHPFIVAVAWWRLYGFPIDFRLWVAFFVHDLGYLGKPNMDGPEGETHVEFGANLMTRWFGEEWGRFTMMHSRFYAKKLNLPFSRLCVADKLALAITPRWLYLIQSNLTLEIGEYMRGTGARTPAGKRNQWQWITDVQAYVHAWALEHRDERPDTWTGTKRDLCYGDKR